MVLFHLRLAETSSLSRRASRAGGLPTRFAVGGEGSRLRNHRGALPGEAPTLPLAKRGGRVKSTPNVADFSKSRFTARIFGEIHHAT